MTSTSVLPEFEWASELPEGLLKQAAGLHPKFLIQSFGIGVRRNRFPGDMDTAATGLGLETLLSQHA